MVSPEHERGLKRMGIKPNRVRWVPDPENPMGSNRAREEWYYADLRDPKEAAFAWRVQAALWDTQHSYWREWYRLCCGPKALKPVDALYATVEEIGRQGDG